MAGMLQYMSWHFFTHCFVMDDTDYKVRSDVLYSAVAKHIISLDLHVAAV